MVAALVAALLLQEEDHEERNARENDDASDNDAHDRAGGDDLDDRIGREVVRGEGQDAVLQGSLHIGLLAVLVNVVDFDALADADFGFVRRGNRGFAVREGRAVQGDFEDEFGALRAVRRDVVLLDFHLQVQVLRTAERFDRRLVEDDRRGSDLRGSNLFAGRVGILRSLEELFHVNAGGLRLFFVDDLFEINVALLVRRGLRLMDDDGDDLGRRIVVRNSGRGERDLIAADFLNGCGAVRNGRAAFRGCAGDVERVARPVVALRNSAVVDHVFCFRNRERLGGVCGELVVRVVDRGRGRSIFARVRSGALNGDFEDVVIDGGSIRFGALRGSVIDEGSRTPFQGHFARDDRVDTFVEGNRVVGVDLRAVDRVSSDSGSLGDCAFNRIDRIVIDDVARGDRVGQGRDGIAVNARLIRDRNGDRARRNGEFARNEGDLVIVARKAARGDDLVTDVAEEYVIANESEFAAEIRRNVVIDEADVRSGVGRERVAVNDGLIVRLNGQSFLRDLNLAIGIGNGVVFEIRDLDPDVVLAHVHGSGRRPSSGRDIIDALGVADGRVRNGDEIVRNKRRGVVTEPADNFDARSDDRSVDRGAVDRVRDFDGRGQVRLGDLDRRGHIGDQFVVRGVTREGRGRGLRTEVRAGVVVVVDSNALGEVAGDRCNFRRRVVNAGDVRKRDARHVVGRFVDLEIRVVLAVDVDGDVVVRVVRGGNDQEVLARRGVGSELVEAEFFGSEDELVIDDRKDRIAVHESAFTAFAGRGREEIQSVHLHLVAERRPAILVTVGNRLRRARVGDRDRTRVHGVGAVDERDLVVVVRVRTVDRVGAGALRGINRRVQGVRNDVVVFDLTIRQLGGQSRARVSVEGFRVVDRIRDRTLRDRVGRVGLRDGVVRHVRAVHDFDHVFARVGVARDRLAARKRSEAVNRVAVVDRSGNDRRQALGHFAIDGSLIIRGDRDRSRGDRVGLRADASVRGIAAFRRRSRNRVERVVFRNGDGDRKFARVHVAAARNGDRCLLLGVMFVEVGTGDRLRGLVVDPALRENQGNGDSLVGNRKGRGTDARFHGVTVACDQSVVRVCDRDRNAEGTDVNVVVTRFQGNGRVLPFARNVLIFTGDDLVAAVEREGRGIAQRNRSVRRGDRNGRVQIRDRVVVGRTREGSDDRLRAFGNVRCAAGVLNGDLDAVRAGRKRSADLNDLIGAVKDLGSVRERNARHIVGRFIDAPKNGPVRKGAFDFVVVVRGILGGVGLGVDARFDIAERVGVTDRTHVLQGDLVSADQIARNGGDHVLCAVVNNGIAAHDLGAVKIPSKRHGSRRDLETLLKGSVRVVRRLGSFEIEAKRISAEPIADVLGCARIPNEVDVRSPFVGEFEAFHVFNGRFLT